MVEAEFAGQTMGCRLAGLTLGRTVLTDVVKLIIFGGAVGNTGVVEEKVGETG